MVTYYSKHCVCLCRWHTWGCENTDADDISSLSSYALLKKNFQTVMGCKHVTWQVDIKNVFVQNPLCFVFIIMLA